MIPIPRGWVLTSAMLVGAAIGFMAATAATVMVGATVRPDVVIALVVGVPSALGMVMVLLSHRSWMTALGASVVAVAPGWFGALVAFQAVHGA